jgi:penicillin amidase
MVQRVAEAGGRSAPSDVDGEVCVHGLREPVVVRRDGFGVAHVRAANEHDAWFGQGYAAAQDRLWQMEYDRLRAAGRWAEAAGQSAVPGDRLARRVQLVRSAHADWAAMRPATRAIFEAYAAGVNAFIATDTLPPEYALTDIAPEEWEPWHSLALFKIRHVLMGVWQQKLVLGRLLAMIGPEAYARLDGRSPEGSPLILPPSGDVAPLLAQAVEELRAAAAPLGFLNDVEPGSNSWAVHGSRTTTGLPVTCNDSHRALDVPTVYWQAHVACPDFDVIGATFPGLPGFPHFGHNGRVAWSITHTGADYQDLYVEEFDGADPSRYRTPDGWATAEQRSEMIRVRGGEPVPVELWRTRHGPIVHGDPRRGHAIALRYTATEEPCFGMEPLRPMLDAGTVDELFETQREWVDPVNNLVAADTAGNIGYLTRGYLPIRSSTAARAFPAAGWTGEVEWTGRVPFEQLPRSINPSEGFIVTANQRVIDADEPYIAGRFAVPSRAARVRELLAANDRMSPAQIAALQGDVTSIPARLWGELLARVGPFDGVEEQARQLLAGWDGDLLPESSAALLYACFRRSVVRTLFAPIVGEAAWKWLASGEQPALGRTVSQWLGNVVWSKGGEFAETAPDGRGLDAVLPEALAAAWQDATARGGPDPAAWRWSDHHSTAARHPLAAMFFDQADSLNPSRAAVGGDGDTIQCSGYGFSPGKPFDIDGLSVYRQVVDLADVAHASYVVPGGVCGVPGMPHAADQLEPWRIHERIRMHYDEGDVRAATQHTLTLRPV